MNNCEFQAPDQQGKGQKEMPGIMHPTDCQKYLWPFVVVPFLLQLESNKGEQQEEYQDLVKI